MKFDNFKFKPFLNQAVKDLNFIEATNVQEKVIPMVLQNNSLIVKSPTGTGKTHSFLLPLLERIDTSLDEVQVIIISPTRELAMQLFNELGKLLKYNDAIDARLYVGGTDKDIEIKRLEKKQPQIIVGTIGKIKLLTVDYNSLKIHTAFSLVVDEADIFFALNDIEEIDRVFAKLRDEIQLLTFSATIDDVTKVLINKYFRKCEMLDFGDQKVLTNIEYLFIPTKNEDKNQLLLSVLKIYDPYLMLIFANTNDNVFAIAEFLTNNGYDVSIISGKVNARERKQTLKKIRSGKVQYVVCSDLASRGIDIQGVSHVINYDLPQDFDFFVHRTGRTGRYNFTGISLSFYDYTDNQYIRNLSNKGIRCKFVRFQEGQLIPIISKERLLSSKEKIEQELHKKIPLSKKIKPGYKKKRMETINKELRKIKRERIENIYRKKNRDN